MRIAEAFDSINDQHLTSDPRLLAATSPEKSSGGFRHSGQLNDSAFEPTLSTDLRPSGDSDKRETQIPADLITSCVASLLMIQVTPINILPFCHLKVAEFSLTAAVIDGWGQFGGKLSQLYIFLLLKN